jgi:hypothetical protein
MTPAAHVVFTPSASPQSPLAAVDADSDNQDQLDGLTRDRLRAEAREDVRTYFLPAAAAAAPTPEPPSGPAPLPQPAEGSPVAAVATVDVDSDDIFLIASGPADTGLTGPCTSGSQGQIDGSPIATYGGGGSDRASAADRAELDYEEYQDDITGIVLGLCGGGGSDAESPSPKPEPKTDSDAGPGLPREAEDDVEGEGEGEGKGKGQDSCRPKPNKPKI